MIKTCKGCTAQFWARWRNDPPYCPQCMEGVHICPNCQAMSAPPPDPLQLSFWPMLPRRRPPERPKMGDYYVEHSHQASQATKRKYPYH